MIGRQAAIPPYGIATVIEVDPKSLGRAICVGRTIVLGEPCETHLSWSSRRVWLRHWIWVRRRTCTLPAISRACARGGQAHHARCGYAMVSGMTITKQDTEEFGFPRSVGMTRPSKQTGGIIRYA